MKSALHYSTEMRLLFAMTYFGIRPWGVYATFEIADGSLERSRVSVGGFKDGKPTGYEGLIPMEYEVISEAHPLQADQSYSVVRPHVTGGPLEILQVRMVSAATEPASRTFDVNLRCLTAMLDGCSYSDLAPSAWSDYQRQMTPIGR